MPSPQSDRVGALLSPRAGQQHQPGAVFTRYGRRGLSIRAIQAIRAKSHFSSPLPVPVGVASLSLFSQNMA
jgi:hypothetical protein